MVIEDDASANTDRIVRRIFDKTCSEKKVDISEGCRETIVSLVNRVGSIS